MRTTAASDEANSTRLKQRTRSSRRLFFMATRLRELHPTVYRLRRPVIPPGASLGTVVAVFISPVFIAALAQFAGWTQVAVAMSFALPFLSLVAALYTPLPLPAPRAARLVSDKVSMMSKVARSVMGCATVAGRCGRCVVAIFGHLGALIIGALDRLLCGHFQQ
eukprot:5868686-Prymnesium_polylepis.1